MAAAQSIWKMAFRNLTAQNTTTVLTVAAIAVCVMTFVSIFSILDGLQLTIQTVMKGYYGEREIFVLTSAASSTFQGSSIPRAVADQYRRLPEVVAVSEEALVWAESQGIEIELSGIDLADFEMIYVFQRLDGRRFQAPGECMAGRTLANTVGIEKDGQLPLTLGNATLLLRVVGIFETRRNATSLDVFRNDTRTPMDAQLLVSLDYLSSLLPAFEANSSIMRLRVADPDAYQAVEQFTRENHPELRIWEARQVSKFFEKSIINISRLLSTIIVFVVLLMVLGIYNSMNMVVSERRWEIGVLRAVGARRSFVLRLFIVESAALAFLGGLFGVALGIAMSHAITSFFSVMVPGSSGIVPLTRVSTIVWGIVAALSIGLIGGISPANRASRIQIAEALSEG